MTTAGIATVFGGSGFIGRYVVKRLAQRGYVVRVAVRDPESALFLKTMGTVGQIVPLAAPVTRIVRVGFMTLNRTSEPTARPHRPSSLGTPH